VGKLQHRKAGRPYPRKPVAARRIESKVEEEVRDGGIRLLLLEGGIERNVRAGRGCCSARGQR